MRARNGSSAHTLCAESRPSTQRVFFTAAAAADAAAVARRERASAQRLTNGRLASGRSCLCWRSLFAACQNCAARDADEWRQIKEAPVVRPDETAAFLSNCPRIDYLILGRPLPLAARRARQPETLLALNTKLADSLLLPHSDSSSCSCGGGLPVFVGVAFRRALPIRAALSDFDGMLLSDCCSRCALWSLNGKVEPLFAPESWWCQISI